MKARWEVVALAAMALLVLMALMDGPSEIEAAQDTADQVRQLEYAKAVADGGRAICAAHGRTPAWLADGSLVCRKPAVQVAGGAK